MAELKIRDATKDDVPLLGEMHHRSHVQNYAYFLPPEYFKAINVERFTKHWKERFEKVLYRQRAWIAELDGKPVGFCNAELARNYPDGYSGHLDNLHLVDGTTGQGTGKKMFNLCRDYMFGELGVDGFYLVVYQGHVKARKFYESIGGLELNFRERNAIAPGLTFTYTSYGWKK